MYYGLCEAGSLHHAAGCILPRRGALYPVSSIRIRPDESAPLVYLAVRDPSAVRVVPVGPRGRGKASPQDFDHITLVFSAPDRPGPGGPDPATIQSAVGAARQRQQAGFVVTIGLRTELESEFHERVILAHHDRPYAELWERIMSERDQFSSRPSPRAGLRCAPGTTATTRSSAPCTSAAT